MMTATKKIHTLSCKMIWMLLVLLVSNPTEAKEPELPLCPTGVQYYPQNLPMHCRMPKVNTSTNNIKPPNPVRPMSPIAFPIPGNPFPMPGLPDPYQMQGNMYGGLNPFPMSNFQMPLSQMPGQFGPGQMSYPPGFPGFPGVPGMGMPPPGKPPVVVMPYYSPSKPSMPTKSPKHRRYQYDIDELRSINEEEPEEPETISYRRKYRKTKTKKSNSLLTPMLQYVTKDGYVIFEKPISKNEAKGWLGLSHEHERPTAKPAQAEQGNDHEQNAHEDSQNSQVRAHRRYVKKIHKKKEE